MMNGVSVIIPVKNGEGFLERCLSSISNQTGIECGFEIIVVNNESTDNSKLIANEFPVTVIDSHGKSAAAVRNDGVKSARFNIIGFLDADCVAPNGWVSSAYKLLEQESEYGCVGGGCFADPHGNWVQKAWALSSPVKSGYVKALSGASMFFRKKFFFQIGGFDTKLISAEDDEICSRVIKSSKKNYRDESLWVIHLDYPRSLKDHFVKSRWHGATQIAAHGFFGDNLVMLTWMWGVCLISSFILVFLNPLFSILLFLISIVFPLAFALKRMRSNIVGIKKYLYLPLTYLICLAVMSGRLLSMFREVKFILKAKLSQ